MIKMIELIEEIIGSLNLDFGMQLYEGKENEYIIFDIFDEEDVDNCENLSISTNYYVTINFWHRNKISRKKYDLIKKEFKKNGFRYKTSASLKDKDLLGRNFIFVKDLFESEE